MYIYKHRSSYNLQARIEREREESVRVKGLSWEEVTKGSYNFLSLSLSLSLLTLN